MSLTETIKLGDYLPPVYRHLLPEFPDLVLPAEYRATCHDCVMCAEGPMPKELQLKSFSPETKCCTYHPSLPNFLVGAILAATEPDMEEGQRLIRAKIRLGIAVTPRGILTPRKFTLLYDNGHGLFGRSKAMRCPYYHEGGCSIWRHREAVCTTYFCRYARGDVGKQFWEALKTYLGTIEHKLSLYSAAMLEPDRERLGALWDSWSDKGPLTPEDIEDKSPPREARAKIWGRWLDREEEFYLACYAKVKELTKGELFSIAGVEEEFIREKTLAAYRAATPTSIPIKLRRNPELSSLKRGDTYFCTNPRVPGDAFELSALIFPLLESFDGERETPAVVKELEVTKNVILPPDLITRLYFLGVLVAA